MSLTRSRYGIEYDPHASDRDGSGLGKPILAVVLIAVICLSVSLVRRGRGGRTDPAAVAQADVAPQAAVSPAATAGPAASAVRPAPPPVPEADPDTPSAAEARALATGSSADRRPVRVRNLLLRLEAAESRRDVELAISTIEQIRALPGQPAADIDDRLARRLGELNRRWLFERHNAQWVTRVTIRPGDSATRLAREHGSTLASMMRLNGWTDADRLVIGRTALVMNHPRFNLVVHRRTRTADLQLNGKFFSRFDLEAEVDGEPGAYETPDRLRTFLAEKKITFSKENRAELEMLLPRGTSVLISEL